MVFGNLMITLASDGLAKGAKAPKSGKKAEKKKRDAAVPPVSRQTTPVTAEVQEDIGSQDAGTDKAHGSAGLFVSPPDEVQPRARKRALIRLRPKKSASFNFSLLQNQRSDVTVPRQASLTNDGPDEEDESSTLEDTGEVQNLPMLDPATTPRQYYREPLTGIKREVWRPGDGDGAADTDYYDKPGQRPLHQRWRFYQLKTGKGPISFKNNMPPKYVILDDRAAHEVLASDIPRASIVRFWSHDFGGPGRIRARRPHRGRSAISNPNATGDEKYFSTEVGMRGEKYYFTGEKNYTPIAYHTPPANEAIEPQSSKRKAESPPTDEPKDPRKHGHNQYTPKDQLVKYGAPSQAKGKKRYRERINTFLRRSPSPEWAKDRAKLYGGIGAQTRAFTGSHEAKAHTPAAQKYDKHPETSTSDAHSLFIEDDEEMRESEDDMTSAAEASDTMTWERQPVEPGNNPTPGAAFHTRNPSIDAAVSENDIPTTQQDHERRHGKKRQPKSFLERMAAEEEDEEDEEVEHPSHRRHVQTTSLDTGTYASQLEVQLMEANAKVKTLTEDLDQAYDRIDELENEVMRLREV
ncbi:hypothetical protein KC332_g14020 [Hortaea werneckii]|uniref:Uncharacterized protein n=2 Tax=Hortaea werneckii TaxID=91943 RepID=A0A3M7J4F3_HORWE|nr:hypothetical protein KC358_g2034 [Hortaea werneckii]KAI6848718.1 hypothetical protein KC350_g2888 [Hortaea werneckii]KAI6940760.1 hypothetical protein KC341_g3305 [Hortaea werneckii]KAI6947795.1 hypothetical protein KC348_g2316 [Hortaea werneckii]KAI6976932.1 hypothetical protein KC321_g3738 [Hortaea werneckii]